MAEEGGLPQAGGAFTEGIDPGGRSAWAEPAVLDREAGHALLEELQDERTRAALPALEGLAPGFPDWVITALFGGTYQRPGLSLRDRQIANLAALTALGGCEPQLAGHVRTSLRIGVSAEEVIEVFVHLAPYVGVPRALAALRVAAAELPGAASGVRSPAGAVATGMPLGDAPARGPAEVAVAGATRAGGTGRGAGDSGGGDRADEGADDSAAAKNGGLGAADADRAGAAENQDAREET
jgi:4-carboxymuconolactone decarboxylase